MSVSSSPVRFRHYADCMAWVADHWQDAGALESIQDILQVFQRQHRMLPANERPLYEAAVHSAPWALPADSSSVAPETSAIFWLDTPEQVRTLLCWKPRGPLQISVSQLSADVAAVLATHQGELSLLGVVRPDWASVQALANRPSGRRMLTLGIGVDEVDSFAGLEPLWSRHDAYINLPAIVRLDDQSAEVLGRIRGTLRLPNLESLTPRQAAMLAAGNLVKLELDGLGDSVLTMEVASTLCSGQVKELSMNALTHAAPGLPTLVAHAWSALQLDGLTQLPLAIADILRQAGLLYLKLNGLTALDLATTKALCGNARAFSLYLNGLTTLDDPVAAVLVGNTNALLEIRQVSHLSPTARKMLFDQGNVESPLLD